MYVKISLEFKRLKVLCIIIRMPKYYIRIHIYSTLLLLRFENFSFRYNVGKLIVEKNLKN